MREHLYRGKTTKKPSGIEFDEVWVYGDLVHSGKKIYIHPQSNSFQVDGELSNLVIMHEVIPETVGEFASVTDKNGKKIFEGDIVEFDGDCKRDTVVWTNGEYNGVTGFRLKRYALFSITMLNHDLFEVIGNIHDNPELLK